jgi:hypothetical protein
MKCMASTINWAFNLESVQIKAEFSLRTADSSPTEYGMIA